MANEQEPEAQGPIGNPEKGIDALLEVYKAIRAQVLQTKEFRMRLYYWKVIVVGALLSLSIAMAKDVGVWADLLLIFVAASTAPIAAYLFDAMVKSRSVTIKRDGQYVEYHIEPFLMNYFKTHLARFLPNDESAPEPSKEPAHRNWVVRFALWVLYGKAPKPGEAKKPEHSREFKLYERYLRQRRPFDEYWKAQNRQLEQDAQRAVTRLSCVGAITVSAVAVVRFLCL